MFTHYEVHHLHYPNGSDLQAAVTEHAELFDARVAYNRLDEDGEPATLYKVVNGSYDVLEINHEPEC